MFIWWLFRSGTTWRITQFLIKGKQYCWLTFVPEEKINKISPATEFFPRKKKQYCLFDVEKTPWSTGNGIFSRVSRNINKFLGCSFAQSFKNLKLHFRFLTFCGAILKDITDAFPMLYEEPGRILDQTSPKNSSPSINCFIWFAATNANRGAMKWHTMTRQAWKEKKRNSDIEWIFQVITIFSASNYYETGSNKGAYLKLTGPNLSPHFVQFTTATNRTRNMTFRQKVGLIESSALRDLSQKIHSVKPQLLQAFQKLDATKSGKQ